MESGELQDRHFVMKRQSRYHAGSACTQTMQFSDVIKVLEPGRYPVKQTISRIGAFSEAGRRAGWLGGGPGAA